MKHDYDYDQLYPGRFLKSGEFENKDVTLTITDVDLEELEDRKGKRDKAILTFAETKKQLVLNKTNGECLKGLFGRAVRAWIGKRVTFFPQTVEAFGAPTLAIRVRGSPDIAADMSIVCKVGRQGDVRVTMKKTGAKPNGTPGLAERVRILAGEYGITDKEAIRAVVQKACGKSKPAELVEEDIQKIRFVLEAAKEPAPPPATNGAAPPAPAEEEHF